MNRRIDEFDLGWRRCATCGVEQRSHHGRGVDHRHLVRPDDEWCDRCDDLVVNGCGTVARCEDDQRERDAELEDERAWAARAEAT